MNATQVATQLRAALVFDFNILFQLYFPAVSLTGEAGKAGSASKASRKMFLQ